MDIKQLSACVVVNPIMAFSFDFLFNCKKVDQASDSKTALA